MSGPLLACLCSAVRAAEARGRPLISFSYDGLAPAVRTINVCISGVGERRFDGADCWERAAEWIEDTAGVEEGL